eukprot:SAG25_NODE_690_length_5919_cov_13.007045_9_plen_277_part_00
MVTAEPPLGRQQRQEPSQLRHLGAHKGFAAATAAIALLLPLLLLAALLRQPPQPQPAAAGAALTEQGGADGSSSSSSSSSSGRRVEGPPPTPRVLDGGFSTAFEQGEWVAPPTHRRPYFALDDEDESHDDDSARPQLPRYLACDACAAVAWQLRAHVRAAEAAQGRALERSQLMPLFERKVCTSLTFLDYSVWEVSGTGTGTGAGADESGVGGGQLGRPVARRVLVGPGTRWEGARVGSARRSEEFLGQKLAQVHFISGLRSNGLCGVAGPLIVDR